MIRSAGLFGVLLLSFCSAAFGSARAQDNFITVAATTSLEQSGLFGYLLPKYYDKTGIKVRVMSEGTGRALDAAKRGDADLLMVNDGEAEDAFIAAGFGVERLAVMYNDFVIAGPASDPAGLRGGRDAAAALAKIFARNAKFSSRGDRSGTHSEELRLWKKAGLHVDSNLPWYAETGQSMGLTLRIASAEGAYVLTDRGTLVALKEQLELMILVEGDPALFNQYDVVLINPTLHPYSRTAEARAFAAWLVSSEGQSTIASFKVRGQQLFFPNAGRGPS